VEATLARAGLQVGSAARPAPAGPQAGLPVGAPAPAFHLDRLDGGMATSAELLALGRPLALAFVDPQCGPCTALLPELARWERELADQVTVAVITAGSVEANIRKLGGSGLGRVLLQDGWEVSEAYQAHGTPSMVIIEPPGTIASPVAPGRDAICGLMARFAAGQHRPGDVARRSRSAIPNMSNGAQPDQRIGELSRIGQPAPDLRLPDLQGKQVSLAAFRGHPTLVLFWNPACGFCQSMLADLKAWEASRSDTSPQLLVVSTGSVEANRAMGLPGLVTLDASFGIGRAFGTSGTPSAVLVDRNGRIASEVAVGGPAALALAAGQATTIGTGT
jgi:peroxiredoxin